MLNVIRLALDNQISRKAAHQLRSMGFQVVYHARNEQDEIWIEAALSNGANIFVSPDLDIPNYLDKVDTSSVWIDIPQRLGGENQASYIAGQISKLRKKLAITSPHYKIIPIEKFLYIVDYNKIDEFLLATSPQDRLKLCYGVIKGNSITFGVQQ